MSLFKSLSSLFFPPVCPICGKLLEDDAQICRPCLAELPRTEQGALRGNLTEELFAKEQRFVRGAAFMFFEKDTPIQNLVHEIKYRDRPELAYLLASEAAKDFMQADFFEDIDVIIPIPLHPRRFRQRGYNQSDYIARGLGDIAKIPVDTTHICRVRNNPKQAMKKGEERKQNVKDIFVVNHPEEMYRKHILLVDDLITSGATMLSCMQAMKTFRGCRISVFALCKTR